ARALVEVAASIVAEEGRLVAAARKTSLLEPEQEHHLEPAGAGPQEVEYGDPSRLGGGRAPDFRTLHSREHLFGREGSLELAPPAQLFDEAHDGLVCANVLARELADRRRLQAVSRAQNERREPSNRVEGRGSSSRCRENRQPLAVGQPDRLL